MKCRLCLKTDHYIDCPTPFADALAARRDAEYASRPRRPRQRQPRDGERAAMTWLGAARASWTFDIPESPVAGVLDRLAAQMREAMVRFPHHDHLPDPSVPAALPPSEPQPIRRTASEPVYTDWLAFDR